MENLPRFGIAIVVRALVLIGEAGEAMTPALVVDAHPVRTAVVAFVR
jgi:hypothetical protein